MRIAITGAQGQLGSQLVEIFGREAISLDLPEFDLTDRPRVAARLMRLRPDVIINTAAYTQVDRAESEPELAKAINSDAVGTLADICRRLDAALVQISTDYVFGGEGSRSSPYLETDRPSPINVYGQTKLDAERLVSELPKHLIIRTCGLYGPPAPRASGNFAATMLRLAQSQKRIEVVNDQHCTPSYTPHVARAIKFLVRVKATSVYHVVNRGATTWYELAAELFRLAGRSVELVPIGSEQYARAARRPGYSVLDPGCYERLADRYPMATWQEALAEYVEAASARE